MFASEHNGGHCTSAWKLVGCAAVRDAPAWLTRLTAWLEEVEPALGHRAHRGGLRRYVEGVLSDSRRKSMEAMWARLRDPGSYQARPVVSG